MINKKLVENKPILNEGLLRFTTAGSVDDGKSTLIGRLLLDSQGLYDDQLDAARKLQTQRGAEGIDLASITDGLRAEQEQGITIDVAYRYFSTPVRKFIIADTPGHEQYTRNMVTGASTADASIILIDARHGLRPQSRRHAYLANLLGIKHLIVAINKLDLVAYDETIFQSIREEFGAFCRDIGVPNLHFIPVSALCGDMIVQRGDNINWYHGKTLLETLESIQLWAYAAELPLRFPVQLVNRPRQADYHDFRAYMGRIESGHVSIGDEVYVLPTGRKTQVSGIISFDGQLQRADCGQSVNIMLKDDIDISRGDMLVGTRHPPRVVNDFEATLCWMSDEPMQMHRTYFIKQASKTLKAEVQQLLHTVNINTLQHDTTALTLGLNDIARVKIRTQQKIVLDDFSNIAATGSFIIIDSDTNNTVAAGMVSH
ncbi:MAG: sulfate adenylyltransferase subunit 1 [Thiohalomonadales bacterium]